MVDKPIVAVAPLRMESVYDGFKEDLPSVSTFAVSTINALHLVDLKSMNHNELQFDSKKTIIFRACSNGESFICEIWLHLFL